MKIDWKAELKEQNGNVIAGPNNSPALLDATVYFVLNTLEQSADPLTDIAACRLSKKVSENAEINIDEAKIIKDAVTKSRTISTPAKVAVIDLLEQTKE